MRCHNGVYMLGGPEAEIDAHQQLKSIWKQLPISRKWLFLDYPVKECFFFGIWVLSELVPARFEDGSCSKPWKPCQNRCFVRAWPCKGFSEWQCRLLRYQLNKGQGRRKLPKRDTYSRPYKTTFQTPTQPSTGLASGLAVAMRASPSDS